MRRTRPAIACALLVSATCAQLLASSPAWADEPLTSAANYTRLTPDGRFEVTSKTDPALTSISVPVGRDDGPFVSMWFVPGFHRNVVIATGGGSALVLPEGGNLIEFDDPSYALLSFQRPSGQTVFIRLGQVMDPATLIPTASHFLWMTSATAEPGAYVIRLASGAEVRIDDRTGAILSSPMGATSAANEAVAGIGGALGGGTGADGCLTWDGFRAALTALGPKEPMPVLPEPFASGCVAGFPDERTDYITVFEAGIALPAGTTSANAAARDPLYGLIPLPTEGAVPEGARTMGVEIYQSIGGSGDTILNEMWDAPHWYDSGTIQWRTLGLAGLDEAQARAAMASLDGRWSQGGRDFAFARARTDLAMLPDGRHHLAAVPAEAGGYATLFDKAGDRLRGAGYFAQSEGFDCFDVVLDADGSHGRGTAAALSEDEGPGPVPSEQDIPWTVSRDVAFDFDAVGTLRRLPPLMDAERLSWGLEETMAGCLAAIDAR